MAVKLNMANIYPPDAEELSLFLPDVDYKGCGFDSRVDFGRAVIEKGLVPSGFEKLDRECADTLAAVLALKKDAIPMNIMMEQEPCTLLEINSPDKASPLLITCNFRETVRMMRETLELTSTRCFLLPIYTHGFTVDMAMTMKWFKPEEVLKALKENEVQEKVGKRIMIIPGLTNPWQDAIKELTEWDVLVGPVSGFLAPLFVVKNKHVWL